MLFTPEEIQQLFFIVDYRIARVIADVLGKDYLSPDDIDVLKKFDFDLKTEILKIPPYWQAFIFGRLAAILSPAQLSSLDFNDLKQYVEREQYPELTTREKAEYNASAMRSYSYIKGMGGKIKDSLSSTISEEEMKIAVAEREREVETAIKEELSEGVLKRKSVQSIVSALGHRLDEWNRDWGRIVATEMENIFQIGTAQMIMKEHGIHAKVYKQVYLGACFPVKDTEFLTNNGFKFLKDISLFDKVFTINKDNGEGEWSDIKNIISYYYKGDMHLYKNASFDLMSTPDHFHLVGKKIIKNKLPTYERRLVRSEDLRSYSCNDMMYRSIDDWKGYDEDYIEFFGRKIRTSCFAQFMGWYLSEGSTIFRRTYIYTKRAVCFSSRISISQYKEENFEEIRKCFEEFFPNRKVYKTNNGFAVLLPKDRDEEAKWFISLGKSITMKIPNEVLNLSSVYLKIFLLAFAKGDGCTEKKYFGRPTGRSFERFNDFGGVVDFYTSSSKMADGLCEVILKCGYSPSMSVRDNRDRINYKKDGSKVQSKYLQYVVRLNAVITIKNFNKFFSVIKDWQGEVGCIEAEKNNTLFVRRNGRMMWSGNCRFCINAYTTNGIGSKPVIFDLSELIANGTNIGRKSKDWKATLSPIHPFCFSEDTEVFTNEGWKTFQSLNKNELFLSVNPDTEELEWVKAVRWINQHYKGEMIERTNRSFSLCTTPNHYHAVSTRRIKGICLVSERFLPGEVSFRCAGFKWTGVDKDYFYFDGYKYKADLFCQFMGYFLSEGSATSNKCANYIVLSQFDGDKKEKMFECLSNMGLKPFRSKEYIGATISERKELFAYLKSFGHAYDKFVPKEIKELSPNLLNIFLTAFREGDGVERKPKVYGGYVCKPEVQYFTSSIKLCNDIGEILLKLGYRPSYRNFGKVTAFEKRQNKTYTSKYDNWRISQLSSKGCACLKTQIIDYDGMIGDVELEKYHTLIVRRNGKVCLSGNCRCNLRYVPDGYEWNDKTQSFEPKKVEEKDRVQRKSKVKITVGTKYFEV